MSTMFQGCYLFKKRCDFTAGSGSEEPFHEFMDSLRHAYDVNVVKPNLFICAFSLFQGTDWHSHHKNPGRWPWFLFEPGYVTEVTEVFGLIKFWSFAWDIGLVGAQRRRCEGHWTSFGPIHSPSSLCQEAQPTEGDLTGLYWLARSY
jgi:hypothetical protein